MSKKAELPTPEKYSGYWRCLRCGELVCAVELTFDQAMEKRAKSENQICLSCGRESLWLFMDYPPEIKHWRWGEAHEA